MKTLLYFYSLFLLVSCAQVTQKVDLDTAYKMDMKLSVEGKDYQGFAVAEYKKSYDVTIDSLGELQVLEINSCHRHEVVENAFVKKSIFGKDYKRYVWSYSPNEIEQYACPVFFGAYNQKGQHGWAILELKHPGYSLPASIECNGKKFKNTMSVCQSKVGLTQRLLFDVDVVVTDSGCSFRKLSERVYEFEVARGSCVTAFMEKEEPHRVHRLHTYGFEKFLIRE